MPAAVAWEAAQLEPVEVIEELRSNLEFYLLADREGTAEAQALRHLVLPAIVAVVAGRGSPLSSRRRNDGNITVPQIAAEMAAEGARRVVVVTDEPWKYPSGTKWPDGVTIHHRDDLQEVQKQLSEVPDRKSTRL